MRKIAKNSTVFAKNVHKKAKKDMIFANFARVLQGFGC
jgi:hypothetical protein